MTRPVALDNVAHHDLKVALRHGATFGDAVNQLPLFPSEFEDAQRDFPILFRRAEAEGLQAVALLGLDRDENLFLDGDRWTSRHVPLIAQRGPFLIGLPGDGAAPESGATVQVDLDDPRVGAADGEPLFLPHGGNSRYLDHVGRVLGAIYAGMERGPAMVAAFEAQGLLEPVALELMLDDETRYVIRDYLRVSPERLAALNAGALDALNRGGHLGPAFLLAASIGNFQRLIERKNAKRAAA